MRQELRILAILPPLLLACGGNTESTSGGASAFVGTWARSGTTTTTCPGVAPKIGDLTGNLVIVLGSDGTSIVATQPDGCMTRYAVSGDVASQEAGQVCVTSSGGVMTTQELTTHTFTLSSDGNTFEQVSVGSSLKTSDGTTTTCAFMGSGTYTKE